MSFDVEDYFQVSAFEQQFRTDDWGQLECRVEANVHNILQLLADQNHTRSTFFILGWIAERFPALIKEIADSGHEIASHGYNHQRLINMTREEFRLDVSDSKSLLEELTGKQVLGYRAPSFSLSPQTLWATDALKEAGYHYSSSVNPVPHDLYGMPDAPRIPFRWDNGLLELPVTTVELFNRRFPCAGGGFFRLYPYCLSHWALKKANKQLDGPVIFYLHPWELDPAQPRVKDAPLKSRFRHYLNLKHTKPRLEQLLKDFNWGTIAELEAVTA